MKRSRCMGSLRSALNTLITSSAVLRRTAWPPGRPMTAPGTSGRVRHLFCARREPPGVTMAEAEAPAKRPAPHRVPRRVVSGMRPTGRMHLGHYQGALKNWIEVSRIAECFFFSADWHALTTEYKDPSHIAESQREMFIDWVAAGLDPERCTFFVQSHVKQHAELFVLLGMVAPIGWLERRFNHLYAKEGKPILVEPHPYLTETPKILGLDGRKMSKSYGNAVELGEDPEQARKRIMVAVTDPARKRRHDPGHPEICPIYHLHRAYSPSSRVEMVDRECRSAGIGCVDCKKMLLENLLPVLEKHRAARQELERTPGRVEELVRLGTEKARAIAEQTMVKVRAAMQLD